MSAIIPIPELAWAPTEDPLYPWEVVTPYYSAWIAGTLDAALTPGRCLVQFTPAGSEQTFKNCAQWIYWIDAQGNVDPIALLPAVPATVDGSVLTFEIPAHPEYDMPRVVATYTAEATRLKWECVLHGKFRAPADHLDRNTTILSISGPIDHGALILATKAGATGDVITTTDLLAREGDETRITMERLQAWDRDGRTTTGEFRVVADVDGAPDLHQGVSWRWLDEAPYPVTIDPSLVVASSSLVIGARTMAVLPDGTQYEVLSVGGVQKLYCSTDNGQNWSFCANLTGTNAYDLAPDQWGNIWALIWSASPAAGALRLERWAPGTPKTNLTGIGTALVSFTVTGGYTVNSGSIAINGATLWASWNESQISAGLVRTCPVTITSGGTATPGTHRTIASDGSFSFNANSICVTADGTAWLYWNDGSSHVKRADGTGSVTYSDPINSGSARGVSGLSAPYWVCQSSNALRVVSNTGLLAALPANSVASTGSQVFAAAALPVQGLIAISARRGSAMTNPNYPGGWTVKVSDGTVTDRGALQTTLALSSGVQGVCGPITNSRVPISYESTGVRYDELILNSAPYAPLLSVSAAAFPAAEGVQIQITHQDLDGDNGGAYRLKRVNNTTSATDYWNGSAWVGSETDNEAAGPDYTISAASNAGMWTSGHTYTLYAATRDTSGVWGEYTPVGIVVTPGVRPVAGLTSPGVTVTSGTVTAQGTSTAPVSAYRYELLAADGTTLIEDGGWVSATTIPPKTFAYVPTNLTDYQVRFTCKNTTGAGIESMPAVQPFTTSFTPPAAPFPVLVTENNAEASIAISWTQPAGTTPALSWIVQRSKDGGANWTTLATVSVTHYTDYSPASGVSYLYRVQAVGTNGTLTASATVAGSVTWSDWVFRPVDGGALITFSGGPARAPWQQGQEIHVPETQSAYRREFVGPYKARTVDLSAMFGNSGPTAYETREHLRALVLSRAEGWLKSPSGDVMRGKFKNLGGEIQLPTRWEDLRLQFVEMRGAS